MIPLEDFFRKPDKIALRLSPDGKSLAWLEPWERRLNLTVQNLADGSTRRVTAASERDLGGYVWVSSDRLVYVQDTGGDENYRLYAVGSSGDNPIDLTPFEGVKCDIVDDLEQDDDHILFQMNRRDPQLFDVYRLNVHDGSMSLVGENPGNIQSWFTDHDGKLRLATTTDGVNTSLLARETEAAEWRTVATYDFKEYARPQLFTFDNRGIFVASNLGRDTLAIAEYDLSLGREVRVLFEHDDVDIENLLFSRARKCLTGVAFEVDRLDYHFFDTKRAELQAFVDGQLSGRENTVVSHSRDETLYVVCSANDRTLGAYYLLDAQARTLTHLFEISPWLDEQNMAEMRPIRFSARDGLTIHGYLTLPPGSASKSLPLVVHPHGGPWARDRWGFDPELQFLASRGYAVLQVNFRSSAGFGRKFLEAGFGQWGLSMQDDITDGVRWAIDEGIADPARIAIYGGSYGGYATLAGLTKTPDLYACGISYVGVSNLFTWIESIPPYWKPYLEMIHEMVGHPERDSEQFEATSPFFNADKIVAPLFVAQGANDPRVPKQESDQIVEALRSRKVEVTYMVKENEGHGFLNEENRFDFYREMERFLDRWLAPGD
jgi:dipeptidyl aminopeptidase/acylaminoacyl peptidase